MTTSTKRNAVMLQSAAKRAEIIDLRMAGHTLEAIAAKVGLGSSQAVRYHIDAWLSEQRPSSEQTEELRQFQARQIDSLATRLEARVESDDYLAVTDRLVKLMDRKARLMGLDLTVGVTVNVLTRESLAELIWVDDAPAIEGEAVEIEAGDSSGE